MNKRKLPKITCNAPVTIIFALLCLGVMALNAVVPGLTARYFSVYRASLTHFTTYLRFFTHIIGHADWEHLLGNMMLFLVLGPLLEEKYGSLSMLAVLLATALVTGLANFVFFPHARLMGASGVVFAMILLSSMTGFRKGTLPLTFIAVALLYLGQQVYQALFVADNISQLTHILGGAVGSILGLAMNSNGEKR